MKVICAGLSKTGTKSLAKALRILGFSVFDYLEHRDIHCKEWVDLYCEGKLPDFGTMYKGVDAVIGLPASLWYEEVREVFPDAKVILSLRDNEDVWAQSWAKHIKYCTSNGGYRLLSRVALDLLVRIFTDKVHHQLKSFLHPALLAAFGTMNSKCTVVAKKKYRQHNERVEEVIPTEKLLIYNVKQGWKPLCEFLGCDVPDQDFPRENMGTQLCQSHVSARLQLLKRNIFFSVAFFVLLLSMLYLAYSQTRIWMGFIDN